MESKNKFDVPNFSFGRKFLRNCEKTEQWNIERNLNKRPRFGLFLW